MQSSTHSTLHATIEKFQELPLSRREFLRRTAQLGSIVPVSSALQALWSEKPTGNEYTGLKFFSQRHARLLALMAEILVEPESGWPTITETQVVEYIDQAMAASDEKIRNDFLELLDLFENRFIALLFDLRFEAFSAMTKEEQHDYLRDWMTSNLEQRRTGFMALKRLTTSAYYTHQSTWPKLSYAGPLVDQPEKGERQLRIAKLSATNRSYDAIIIGSGAGGSVVAARLTQAGWRVAIIEKGGHYDRHDFTQNERDMVPAMFMKRGLMATDDLSFILLAGECVGGGTTVNWCTSMEVPEHVLADWRRRTGFADLTNENLKPYYDLVRQRLRISPVPDSDHNVNNRIIFDGGAKLGLRTKTIHRNAVSDAALAEQYGIPACIQCGFCGVGCAYDAKRTTLVTYLVDAVGTGADLFVHTKADKIVVSSDGAKKVMLIHDNGRDAAREFELTAPIVVVACGGLQSPALLLRSGLANGSGQVGRNLYLHPTTALFGFYDRDIEMGYGIPQSALCDAQIDQGDGYGFWLETAPAHPGLAAIATPEFGAAHRDLMRQYPQMSNIIILARDLGSGRVTLDDAGEASVHYELHERDERSVLDGMKLAARIMQAAGARRVQTLHAEGLYADFDSAPLLKNKEAERGRGRLSQRSSDPQKVLQEFERELDQRGIEPNRCAMFSAHQMGTCRMGSDSKNSVVDRFGECHEVKGLYLADASIFPASAGINPMLPIMALAEEIALQLTVRKAK